MLYFSVLQIAKLAFRRWEKSAVLIRSGILLFLSILASTNFVAATSDQPVGVMLASGGSRLLRAGTETALASRPGELLFPGDQLSTTTTPASFLFCPGKTKESLLPGGEIQLRDKRLRLLQGKTTEQPVGACTCQ